MKKYLPFILLGAGLLMSFNSSITGLVSPASLDIKISKPPVVMPALYKVYANEDALEGKYSLFKMVITNNSSVPAKNVEVTYKMSGFLDWTTAKKIPLIQPGQTVVVNAYPKFEDKIVEKTTTSKETVNTVVKGSNVSAIENDFSIPVKGRNEFMYTFLPSDEIRTPDEYFDNMQTVACYVTPEDPIIKYFTQQIQEKVLKGETASVTNSEKESVRFLQGIYYATLVSHMVYSGTTGVPVSLSDVNSIVQSIRLPREVISGKTGLCIELSILYASIMMSAGMDPIIYMIPGHAYPGFKVNGSYYAIEATAIGGEGRGNSGTPDAALQQGMKQLAEFFQKANAGDPRYFVVDVRNAIKNGALAIELKDDQFLRQKVDEIAKSFTSGAISQTPQVNNANAGGGNQGGGGGNDGGGNGGGGNDGGGNGGGGGGNGGGSTVPSGYKAYNGVLKFAYPSSWSVKAKSAQIPELKTVIYSRDGMANAEVYSFSGTNSPEAALNYLNQYVSSAYGGGLQYQKSGSAGGYQVYNGNTSIPNVISINWVAAFKPQGNNKLAGLILGTNAQSGNKYQSTISNILNTLQ